jgi:uncharacterized protein YfiM (DUF2279 family)
VARAGHGEQIRVAAPSLLAAALLLSAGPAATAEPQSFSLGLSFPALPAPVLDAASGPVSLASAWATPDTETAEAPELPGPNRTKAILLSSGVVVGSALSALVDGFATGLDPFHFAQEGWFSEDEYSGGADKVSHFVFYNGLARELGLTFRKMGYEENRALALGFGVAMTAGVLVEVGDGFRAQVGFAWEDIVMDAFGAATAVFVSRHGLDDVIGFRFGKISAPIPPPCCQFQGVGKDYSSEIYTADLKLAGVARRLNVFAGPARFLLVSATYGSKGYRYSFPEFRERNIGIELGINFTEILTAVGVQDTTWWGRGLFIFFNFFRVPFTSIGFYYDLNHGRWSGPNNGQVYYPGP